VLSAIKVKRRQTSPNLPRRGNHKIDKSMWSGQIRYSQDQPSSGAVSSTRQAEAPPNSFTNAMMRAISTD
jgi:hypothetical protein